MESSLAPAWPRSSPPAGSGPVRTPSPWARLAGPSPAPGDGGARTSPRGRAQSPREAPVRGRRATGTDRRPLPVSEKHPRAVPRGPGRAAAPPTRFCGDRARSAEGRQVPAGAGSRKGTRRPRRSLGGVVTLHTPRGHPAPAQVTRRVSDVTRPGVTRHRGRWCTSSVTRSSVPSLQERRVNQGVRAKGGCQRRRELRRRKTRRSRRVASWRGGRRLQERGQPVGRPAEPR